MALLLKPLGKKTEDVVSPTSNIDTALSQQAPIVARQPVVSAPQQRPTVTARTIEAPKINMPLETAKQAIFGIGDSLGNIIKTVTDSTVKMGKMAESPYEAWLNEQAYHKGQITADELVRRNYRAYQNAGLLSNDPTKNTEGSILRKGVGIAGRWGTDVALAAAGGGSGASATKLLPAVVQGAKYGAGAGATGGLFDSMQKDEFTPGSVIKDVATGAVTGGVAGGLFGAAGYGVKKLAEKAGKVNLFKGDNTQVPAENASVAQYEKPSVGVKSAAAPQDPVIRGATLNDAPVMDHSQMPDLAGKGPGKLLDVNSKEYQSIRNKIGDEYAKKIYALDPTDQAGREALGAKAEQAVLNEVKNKGYEGVLNPQSPSLDAMHSLGYDNKTLNAMTPGEIKYAANNNIHASNYVPPNWSESGSIDLNAELNPNTADIKPRVTAENTPGASVVSDGTNITRVKPDVSVVDQPSVAVKNVTKDPKMQELLQTLANSRNSANVQRDLAAAQVETEAKKQGIKLNMDFVNRYESGNLTDKERPFGDWLKQYTDTIFKRQSAITPDINYVENYLPHQYQQDPQAVKDVLNVLKTKTSAGMERTIPTYETAVNAGLTPRYNDVSQMLGANVGELARAEGNRTAIQKGLELGLLGPSQKGWAPVEGFYDAGTQLYAPKQVADVINGVLQKDTSGLGKTLAATAKVSSTMQDIGLQGGVPATPLNFFTTGQMNKDTTRNIGAAVTGHPVQALKNEWHLGNDLIRSFSTDATDQRFAANADFVKELADNGLPITFQTKLTNANKNVVAKGWDALGNDPTFGRFMPNRLLSTAQETYTQAVKNGVGHDEAVKLAADTTKNFYGIVDQVAKGRSQITQDALSTGLFAPKYRESVINALGSALKSVFDPRTWGDKAYQPSRQLMAGMITTLIGYDALNRQLNGHGMLQNRKGQELSLQIPYGEKDSKGNQKVVNVPFMPGFMTLPRAGFNATTDIATGDIKGAVGEASKGLSMPIATAGSLVGNKDYFGRPIYIDQQTADQTGTTPDSAATAAGKVAGYVVGQNTPAWVRAGIDLANGKPTEQVLATAAEAPVRFGTVINPDTQAYFDAKTREYNKLSPDEKSAFDTVFGKTVQKDAFNNAIGNSENDPSLYDSSTKANLMLKYPNLLAAANAINNRPGQPSVDPFYKLPADKQVTLLTINSLSNNPGNADAKKLRNDNASWLNQYYADRESYFANLPKSGSGSTPAGGIPVPQKTTQVSRALDAYNQLSDSAARAEYIANNPGLSDYFQQQSDYMRAKRAALGLPQYDKYPEPDAQTKSLMDEYNALPKGDGKLKADGTASSPTRSAWIKAHPAEWDKITAQFSRQAQYGLQQDATNAQFEGEQFSDKGIKDIMSLARDLGMSISSNGGYNFKKSNPTANSQEYALSLNAGGSIKKMSVSSKSSGAKKTVSRKTVNKPKVTIKSSKV